MAVSTSIGLAALLVFFLLIPRFRMWIWLRFYRKIQRDFFSNRVYFRPERTVPLRHPPRTLYNFIEADQFIAILREPDRELAAVQYVLHIMGEAQSIIKHSQQTELQHLLEALQTHSVAAELHTLINGALASLEQAVLIDG